MNTEISNSLIDKILDESAVGMSVYNSDGACVFSNQPFADIIGATKEQVLSQNFNSIDSWRKAGLFEAAKTTLKDGAPYKDVKRVTTTFGKDLWLEYRFNRFNIEKELFLALVIEDVSEREIASNLQKKTSERFETLVAAIPGVTYTVVNDEQWTMEFISEQVEELTGYPASDFVQNKIRSFYLIIFNEDLKKIDAALEEAFETRQPFTIEYRITHADGTTRWIYEKGRGIYNSEGEVTHFTGVVLDITEQKRAEEMHQTSQLMLNRIIEQSPLPIYIADTKGTMVRCNRALTKLLEVSEDALVGKYNFYSDPVVKEQGLLEGVKSVLEKGETYTFFCSWTSADFPDDDVKKAKDVDIEGVLFPIFDTNEVITNAVCIYADVTEERKTVKEREELIDKLEAQNAELERFTYTVSHDLKTPLITVGGFVELIREKLAGEITEKIDGYFDHVLGATDKMQALLGELLELSRIGRIASPFETVDLKELANETVKLLAAQISNVGATIEISPQTPTVFGDRTRLGEVLQNLFDNALKYSAGTSSPVIKFGSRFEDGEDVFFVSDTGIGIEPQYRRKVFDLFDQLDQKSEGSGVGLALVKRIIETHKGRIWVESGGRGSGSTFCFTLPSQ